MLGLNRVMTLLDFQSDCEVVQSVDQVGQSDDNLEQSNGAMVGVR